MDRSYDMIFRNRFIVFEDIHKIFVTLRDENLMDVIKGNETAGKVTKILWISLKSY